MSSTSPNLQAQSHVDEGTTKIQKRRPKRDEDQPPRALNCFMLFRQEFSKANPKECKKMGTSTAAGIAWKNLSKKQKEHWQMLADLAREEHKRLYPDYKFRPKRREQPAKKEGKQPAKKRRVAPPTDDEAPEPADNLANSGHLEALDNLPFNNFSPPASADATPDYEFTPLPDAPSLLLDGSPLPPQGHLYDSAAPTRDFSTRSPSSAPRDAYTNALAPDLAPFATPYDAPIELPTLPDLPELCAQSAPNAHPAPNALPLTHVILVLRRTLCDGCHSAHYAAFPRTQWPAARNDAAFVPRDALCGHCVSRCDAVEQLMLQHAVAYLDRLEGSVGAVYDETAPPQEDMLMSPMHQEQARTELFQLIAGDEYVNYDAVGPA